MNILIVSQYFWPENFRINDLVFYLRQQGHDVTVLTGLPNYPEGHFTPGHRIGTEVHRGVKIKRVPLFPRLNGKGWQLACNYLSFAVSASLLGPFLCRGKVDAIFVHEPSPITVGFPAIVMKRLRRAPILFWVLDLWPESLVAAGGTKSESLLDAVRGMVRYIYRWCDLILVQSRGFIPHTEALADDPAKVRYFPSWAEELYRPIQVDEAEAGAEGLPGGFRVMFAGNVGVAQDFENILNASERLREHEDICWVVVGDGRMLAWVREQVKLRGLDDRVCLLGRRPLEDMPRLLAMADAVLVTLKREPIFALTIPGKVQSYMACGRPIIAMLDGEGARIVEESGAGYACPAEDAEALASAVLAMHGKKPEGRAAMGERARAYYEENFERSMLFSRLETWMRQLAGKERGSPQKGRVPD